MFGKSNSIEPSNRPTDRNSGKLFNYVGVLATWLVVLAGSAVGMFYYSKVMHSSNEQPVNWPDNPGLVLSKSEPTLVMFIESNSVCTQASLSELDVIMAVCQKKFAAYVVLVEPEGVEENPDELFLKQTAEHIPRVHVVVDKGGKITRCFHAEPAGATFIYNESGKLIYEKDADTMSGHVRIDSVQSHNLEIVGLRNS